MSVAVHPPAHVVAVNGGSSSVKCAVFTSGDPPQRVLTAQVERIGTSAAGIAITGSPARARAVVGPTFAEAASAIVDAVRARLGAEPPCAIGHRIVQGGVRLLDHRLIDDPLLRELRDLRTLDLSHLPGELALIDAFRQAFPGVPEVACFDSAFHRELPAVAQALPIPRSYLDAGYRRLGYHGLSYASLMQELARRGRDRGRVVLAHLGSGASLAAVRDGAVVDTTMGFTPTSGLVMGTRPGDLDPGLLAHLIRRERLDGDALDDLLSRRCGLAGISGTTGDMRDLLALRPTDARAALAIEVFCYQARKWIGAMAACMDGLDVLVFSGGIGEHVAVVRAAICTGLSCLGVELDASANAADAAEISSAGSRTAVLVLPTDEEAMIATIATRLAPPIPVRR